MLQLTLFLRAAVHFYVPDPNGNEFKSIEDNGDFFILFDFPRTSDPGPRGGAQEFMGDSFFRSQPFGLAWAHGASYQFLLKSDLILNSRFLIYVFVFIK